MTFDIVRKSIPLFTPALVALINNELQAGTFDPGEIQAASQSEFYRHVDFANFTF